jgi:hypothetical protein
MIRNMNIKEKTFAFSYKWFVCLLFLLFFHNVAHAKPFVVCKGCEIETKVLKIEQCLANTPMAVIWSSHKNGQDLSSETTIWLWTGEQLYETRTNPDWQGIANYLMLSHDKTVIDASLQTPSFEDELAIFLSEQPLSWGQPNFLRRNPTLFGIKWDLLLLVGALFAGATLSIWKRRLSSIYFGFGILSAFLFLDLRAGYERGRLLSNLYTHPFYASCREHINRIEKVERVIGRRAWCIDNAQWPLTTLIQYRLSDHPYSETNCEVGVVATLKQIKVFER